MELIDANELLKHALPAKNYSPEMLVVGTGHIMSALRYPEDGWRALEDEGHAHELWALAQLAPGEGIEDGVNRIHAFLSALARDQHQQNI